MNKLLRVAAALSLAAGVSQAAAWGKFGHMVVAAVAYEQLKATPAVLARVDELLKLNPKYAEWTAGVPDDQRSQVAFLHAAHWPDDIRDAPGYVADGKDNGNTPVEPAASKNVGYVDMNLHKYWHFEDLGFSKDGTPLQLPPKPNAETQIVRFAATLGHPPAPPALQSYDLVWLIHLVGDVHQPLHATARFTADAKRGDGGGNTVKISCPAGVAEVAEAAEAAAAAAVSALPSCEGDNLHSFWDHALGNEGNLDAAVARAQALPPAPAAKVAVSAVHQWLLESLALAKSDVYAAPVGPKGHGSYELGKAYRQHAVPLAEQRVALAGARLAKLIQTRLK